jgi:hypothetical protein
LSFHQTEFISVRANFHLPFYAPTNQASTFLPALQAMVEVVMNLSLSPSSLIENENHDKKISLFCPVHRNRW